MLCVIGLVHWRATRSDYELTILPLGGGHSVFVNTAGVERDWLIDCGNTNAVKFLVEPFLHAQGVNQLSRLLLMHGDLRHVGGAQPVSEAFRVREIVTSSVRFRSPAYRRIVASIQGNNQSHRLLNYGDQVGPWSVLHPAAAYDFSQADDGALVLLGKIHGVRVLLLSDLGRPGQEVLLNRTNGFRADIVVTGLPVQTEPISDALLDTIQPKAVIVADSEFPATERARPTLRERLTARGVPVFYTRTDGAVTITIRPKNWDLRAASGKSLPLGTTANAVR